MGHTAFTIVCAVYNAEAYLDELLESIFEKQNYQSKDLFFIAVDDGSIDNSLRIIEKWISKFPDQIRCFEQENAGQSSARNTGLRHVETEWVTFVDSDDFLSENYFATVDNEITNNSDIKIVCCRNIAYREETGAYKDSHFLKYRFEKGSKRFEIGDENAYPHHSASTSFFRMSEINRHILSFPDDLRISFEDAFFIGEYLLNAKTGKMSFLSDAKYYARRRIAPNSVTGNSLQKPEFWLSCLEYGALRLLKLYAQTTGSVPNNIQKTVLYDLVWRIRYMVDSHSSIECLSEVEQARVIDTFSEIFEYIDAAVIESSPGSIYWYMYKVGLLNRFKHCDPRNTYMYLWSIDFVSRSFVFRTFGTIPTVKLSGDTIGYAVKKVISHYMLGDSFVDECLVRVPFSCSDDLLEAYAGSRKTKIMLHGKDLFGLSVKDIVAIWTKNWHRYAQKGDVWLVSDSVGMADDNGEHFYRYLREFHPKQKAYYVLDRQSPDWTRLKKEGFKLLPYKTKRFEKKLKQASTVVSSQLMKGVMDYWRDSYGFSKRRVFLQHGVAKDDLSEYFNAWMLDLIVTSTQAEYDSIVQSGSPYRYIDDQVILTGIPRFDRLREIAVGSSEKKMILVAPTWRRGIVSGCTELGGSRKLSDGFFVSDYYQKWRHLICSDALSRMIVGSGYTVVFKPHPNMGEMLEEVEWDVPEGIRLAQSGEGYQDLISQAALVITDYSSLSFDAAYIGSPSVYYQFDKESFFSDHTYQPGYFSYEEDGFGPVVSTEEGVLEWVRIFIDRQGVMDEEYQARINSVFSNRDGKCCSRIYEAILSSGSQYLAWRNGRYG